MELKKGKIWTRIKNWTFRRCNKKKARKAKNLTQEQLGELVGVQKAQISKAENSATDARFATILKVFDALDAKVKFSVEIDEQKLIIIE